MLRVYIGVHDRNNIQEKNIYEVESIIQVNFNILKINKLNFR